MAAYEREKDMQKIDKLTSTVTKLEKLIQEAKTTKDNEIEEAIKKNFEQLDNMKQIHKEEIE